MLLVFISAFILSRLPLIILPINGGRSKSEGNDLKELTTVNRDNFFISLIRSWNKMEFREVDDVQQPEGFRQTKVVVKKIDPKILFYRFRPVVFRFIYIF